MDNVLFLLTGLVLVAAPYFVIAAFVAVFFL
mgnify:CR=1 FL=1